MTNRIFCSRRMLSRLHSVLSMAWAIGGTVGLSCGGSARQTDSMEASAEWKDALKHMASGPAAYSLSYFAEPPDGAFWRVLVYEPTAATGCKQTLANLESKTGSFWVLLLEFGTTQPGTHQLVPRLQFALPESLARAELILVVNGQKAKRYTALGGSVNVQIGARDLSEWQSGTQFGADVHVEFPAQNATELECTGSSSREGEILNTCLCEREDQTTFTCAQSAVEPSSCCYDLSAERTVYDLSVEAEQCSQLCIYSQPELESYCQAIWSQP